MNTITLSEAPCASRACLGLGVQADCYIYDDVNRQFGVDDADCGLWEGRLKALRPGIARIFLPLNEFNPSGDGQTYDWDTVEMKRQYRNLATLKEAGACVNLCMGPWTNRQMATAGGERLAVDVLEHLLRERGFDHIRWLSLYNEPDSLFAPDTPLAAELAAAGFGAGRLTLADYVAQHRRTLDLLDRRDLVGRVRLVVGDMAWPPRRRLEWLHLLGPEFVGAPVSYSFHHYAPPEESYERFFAHPESRPHQPPPLADEVQAYRAAVGPEAELICWEFNMAGWDSGNFSHFPGVGPYGEDSLGSFATGIAHARKTLTMLANGVDGLSHWCLGDMFYRSGQKSGVMRFGLWRYKWESWVPRPVYYYYAALMGAFRPGVTLHAVTGLPATVTGLAARQDGQTCVALLNTGKASVPLRGDLPAAAERLRVSPDRLPDRPDIPAHGTGREDLPLQEWTPAAPTGEWTLEPGELTLLRSTRG